MSERIRTGRRVRAGRRSIGAHVRSEAPRAGFSLIELMIVAGILGLMLGGIAMIVDSSKNAFVSGSTTMRVDGEGQRTLARVIEILRGAQNSTLSPTPAPPASTDRIDFQASLGAQPGGVVLDDTQRIRFVAATGRVEWVQDFGLPEERVVVLTSGVPTLLEGELMNNLDDNGNGLVDEAGFCLTLEDTNLDGNVDILRALLTLQRPGAQNTVMTRTFEARLHARN